MAAATALVWVVVGRALRGFSHLRENPRDVAIAPLMAVVVAVIALPIKVWAAITHEPAGLADPHGRRPRAGPERDHGSGRHRPVLPHHARGAPCQLT